MSPEFWELFGFDPATKAHRADEWMDLIFPEDLELAKQNLAEHIADPSHPYDQIVRYKCADGEVAWVRCRGLAIRDASGNTVRLLGAHNSITDQKREERSAQETSALLTQIMDAAQSAIIALDEDGRVASINSAGRHFLGGIREHVPLAWPEDIRFVDSENLQPIDAARNPVSRCVSGEVLKGEIFSMTRGKGRETRYVRVSSGGIETEDTMASDLPPETSLVLM